MKKTLQDQYLLIKEGKGHKGVFLADAKRDFPQYVPNAATFNEAVASLKTKNIISENIIGLSVVAGYEPKKKESYETAFEAFLAEARKKDQEEKEKAELKKPSKQVEEDLEKQYDKTDDKNPDNLIFDQIMMGYYAEMKDPKNADKTMQQLKDMVIKNLSKDPIYYTKDGQFGVKDLGYTTEAPGLGEPKEAKGKYKSSGYGDLNEAIGRNYPGEIEGEYQGNLMNMSGADLYDFLKDMLNISTSEDDFIKKVVYGITDETSSISKENEFKLRNWYKKNSSNGTNEAYEPNIDTMDELDLKSKLTMMGVTPIVVNSILSTKGVEGLRNALKDKLKDRAIGLNESKLRKVIREMIDSELEEATQMTTIINPKKVEKDREERDPQNKYLTFDKDFEKIQKEKGNLIVRTSDDGEDKVFITKVLHANLGPKAGNSDLRKHLMDRTNLESAVLGGKPVFKIKGAKINSKGNISVFVPVEKTLKDLKESVEKDLAAINKEAEHEILQSKLDKIQELIDKKQSQLGKLDEDEDMKALTDAKKVKEIQKDIKALEKAKSKVEKIMGKHKGKKKEVIDETGDEMMDENMPLDDNMMGEEMSYDENY